MFFCRVVLAFLAPPNARPRPEGAYAPAPPATGTPAAPGLSPPERSPAARAHPIATRADRAGTGAPSGRTLAETMVVHKRQILLNNTHRRSLNTENSVQRYHTTSASIDIDTRTGTRTGTSPSTSTSTSEYQRQSWYRHQHRCWYLHSRWYLPDFLANN